MNYFVPIRKLFMKRPLDPSNHFRQIIIAPTNLNIYKIDVVNLSFEKKILDVCVLIIFEDKETPSMYCICHLSERTLNLVDCIKSSSHLHNILPTNS